MEDEQCNTGRVIGCSLFRDETILRREEKADGPERRHMSGLRRNSSSNFVAKTAGFSMETVDYLM